jgi:DNA-binding response OmpR family regulator
MLMPAVRLHPEPLEVCWRKSLLVIDDDPASREVVCHLAESTGWVSTTASSFAEAEHILGEQDVDCVICDLSVGGTEVVNFLRDLAEAGHTLPVLIIGAGDREALDEAGDAAYGLGLNTCYPIAKPLATEKLAIRLARIQRRLCDGIDGCCHRDCYFRRLPQAPG